MDAQPTELVKQPGERLRDLRLKNEWTLEEVAGDLNLKVEVIKALESGDYTNLPERTYIRGYLRSYARLLGISEDVILDDIVAISEGKADLGSVLPVMNTNALRDAQDMPKMSVFRPATKSWMRPTAWSISIILLIILAWWLSGLRPSIVNGSAGTPSMDGEKPKLVELPETE
ncbi:MAG: hypothetical protein CL398_12765 [Acidiferrobacteraceae bacterium]|nr:hypothetical protein [Acidiferrobacteraceae bacterium]